MGLRSKYVFQCKSYTGDPPPVDERYFISYQIENVLQLLRAMVKENRDGESMSIDCQYNKIGWSFYYGL